MRGAKGGGCVGVMKGCVEVINSIFRVRGRYSPTDYTHARRIRALDTNRQRKGAEIIGT